MKSKTKLFLLPIMALVVMAFAIAGVATFNNTPEKVSATNTKTVWFNTNNWDSWGYDNVELYCFKDGGDNDIVSIVSEHDTWCSFTFDYDSYDTIIFKSKGSWDVQTVNISFDGTDNTYYYVNGVSDGKKTVSQFVLSDETKTVYFYNKDDWSGVNAHAFKYINGAIDYAFADYPGPLMSADGKWWSATISADADRVIFSDNGNESKKTSNLTLSDGYAYYYNGEWYKSKQQVEMKKTSTWYLIGAINGASANWNDSTYVCDDDDDKNDLLGNKAEWYNVSLKAGDLIKVVHGNDAPDYTGQWKNCAFEAGVNTVDGSGNGVIMFDGVYNIYLNKAGDTVYINYAEEDLMGAAATGKYQFSTDDAYLLIAAALNPTSDMTAVSPAHTYNVGYVLLDGVDTDHDFNTFYDAIVLKTSGGTVRHTAYNLYNDHAYDDYKVLAYEMAKPASSGTYTYQIYVKCDGNKIAAKTITVTVA